MRFPTLAALLLLLANTIPAQATWTQVATTGPGARSGHAMVFDSQRGVVVLFGGSYSDGTNSFDFGDTWEWNGTAWTLATTTGPSPRNGHAMAYDSQRGRTVLFGGGYNNTDTWEWDGLSWAQVAATGPSAGGSNAMAYDSQRGRTVLFHAPGYPYAGDTWEWDGAVWTPAPAAQPPGFSGPAMAFDSSRGKTVLFTSVRRAGLRRRRREDVAEDRDRRRAREVEGRA